MHFGDMIHGNAQYDPSISRGVSPYKGKLDIEEHNKQDLKVEQEEKLNFIKKILTDRC